MWRLGQQLGVQPGVLLENGLEVGDQLLARLMLPGDLRADEAEEPGQGRLEADQEDPACPRLDGRLGKAPRGRVDRQRGERHDPEGRHGRQQPERLDEAHDREEEEEERAVLEDGGEGQQPDHVGQHGGGAGAPGRRAQGVGQQHPDRGGRRDPDRPAAVRPAL
jgi:hypothetical protein